VRLLGAARPGPHPKVRCIALSTAIIRDWLELRSVGAIRNSNCYPAVPSRPFVDGDRTADVGKRAPPCVSPTEPLGQLAPPSSARLQETVEDVAHDERAELSTDTRCRAVHRLGGVRKRSFRMRKLRGDLRRPIVYKRMSEP
jgi:hypothetical protein